LLRPQRAGHPASRAVLYPLSYRRMGRRTGFEPATSRLADEVTAIFTTDRVEGWRGTGDAVAALASVRASNPLGAVAPYRSNRHLHHRHADVLTPAIESARWGTGDIGVSDGNTGAPFGKPVLWRVATLAWAPPQCVRQRRDSNPLFPWSEVSEIFTTSVWLSRKMRQTELQNKFCRGAVNGAPRQRTLERFALPSVSGISPRSLRQAPGAWARASSARAPGSGSPVPAFAGEFRMSHARTTKNPPERLAREGP